MGEPRNVATTVAAFCFVLGACGPESSPGNVPDIAGAPLAVDTASQLSLGVVEGDTVQEFDRVVTPFLLPDGDVAVPVAGAGTIRVFTSSGRLVRSLGRPGRGPGEFEELHAAWPRGDTIEALDPDLRRITRFLPDGSVEVLPLHADLGDLSGPAGPLGDGWAVSGVASAGFGGRDQISVHRIGRDGADLGEMARAPGMIRYRSPYGSGPEPLSPRLVLAVSNDHVYVGDALTPALRVFDATGVQETQLHWEIDPSRDVRATLRAVIDSAAARGRPEQAALTRRRLEAAPVPAQLPVVRTVIVDDEGFVWLRPYEPLVHSFALGGGVGPGGKWTVLSPGGIPASTVAMPPEIEPSRITTDAMVGIARDELGVESVRVYSMRRRR